MSKTKLGEGIAVLDIDATVEGTVNHVENPREVIDLTSEDLSDRIGCVRAGTSAFASPLLANGVGGLITMEGAPQSHLGIVSREYNIPCIMSLEPVEGLVSSEPDADAFFEEWGQVLDGRTVAFETEAAEGRIKGEVFEV